MLSYYLPWREGQGDSSRANDPLLMFKDSRVSKCARCKKETYQVGLDEDDNDLCLDCWYEYWHEKV